MLVDIRPCLAAIGCLKESTLLRREQPRVFVADLLCRVEQEEHRHAVATLERRRRCVRGPGVTAVLAFQYAAVLVVRPRGMERYQDVLEVGGVNRDRVQVARADRFFRGQLEPFRHRPSLTAVLRHPEAERIAADAVDAVEMLRVVRVDRDVEWFVKLADLLPCRAGISGFEQPALRRVVGADAKVERCRALWIDGDTLAEHVVIKTRRDGRWRDVLPHTRR